MTFFLIILKKPSLLPHSLHFIEKMAPSRPLFHHLAQQRTRTHSYIYPEFVEICGYMPMDLTWASKLSRSPRAPFLTLAR